VLHYLRENANLFAWSAADMPEIDPSVACHQLTVDPGVSVVAQRRRKQSPEKSEATTKAVKDLLEANFISEAKYTTWLSNVVLVKKSNGKWRMCVDYTDLNRAGPKDAYHLPNIDKLVDNSSGYKLLSFTDAYSGYNQIPMAEEDKKKTAFMTKSGNYYYNVMPFSLRNVGAAYQRMMNKVYDKALLGDILEVYMDDMIVKSQQEVNHATHLKRVFEQTQKYNMRLNPEKCTFGVQAGKFLAFYLTKRGIEANPDKCQAFTKLPTPHSKKCIQTLNGMLTALSRFVAKSAQHVLPFFKLLRKETKFEWTDECENALKHLKQTLSTPPVLSRPEQGEVLYLYLYVSSDAVSAVLIRETAEGQKLVYFTSKALLGPETRYQKIEKVALTLLTTAQRLRQYFSAHTVILQTDQPIRQILGRPDVAGRMMKWSLELSEFDIHYESKKALKAQVFADFLAEMTFPMEDNTEEWTVFVDGSSNSKGSGAGIIIENIVEISLGLSFPVTNNTAEYEAFLAGLWNAQDLGAKKVKIFTDSQLVASQVTGKFQVKEEHLQQYVQLILVKMKELETVEVTHVPRKHNTRADILSKLASIRTASGNKTVIQEVLNEPSIQKQKAQLHEINSIIGMEDWRGPISHYIANGELPSDPHERTRLKRKACSFTLVEGILYKKGFITPLIKCLGPNETQEVLANVHDGICRQHLSDKALAKKVLRAGYYWPTMLKDAQDYVNLCDK